MLVDHSGPLVLALPLLEGGELLEDPGLSALLRFELDQGALKDGPRQMDVLGLVLGPLGELEEAPGAGVGVDVPPHNGLGPVGLVAPPLEASVRQPRPVVRHPLHPPLEDGPALGNVPDHLLHVHVLVPEEVDAGQDLDGPVQHVPGAVDELVAHLELGVAEPELPGAVLDLQGPLEHGPGPLVLLVVLLELGILDPVADLLPAVPDVLLEVGPAVPEVRLVLLGVVDLGDRIELVLLLPLRRLPEDLLSGDLNGGRRAVLHLAGRATRHGCVVVVGGLVSWFSCCVGVGSGVGVGCWCWVGRCGVDVSMCRWTDATTEKAQSTSCAGKLEKDTGQK